MFKVLLEKELKNVVSGPKFAAAFAVCSVLILLSSFVAVKEYHQAVSQYEAASKLSEQEMHEQSSWGRLRGQAYRKPHPLQIFTSGVNYDIGRFSSIDSQEPVRLTHSVYSDDPIFALFRFIDLAFIVKVVLSMLALLFTYDAVSGERERGTLKLVFSNAVSRAGFILAKLAGTWLGLVIPLMVSVLLALLMVLVWEVPLAATDLTRVLIFGAVSLLYFTFFITFGVFVSSVTRRSSVSFLWSLVAWVLLVLIIPRGGVMVAGQLLPVPSAAEMDGQIDGFAKDRWDAHMARLAKRWEARNAAMNDLDEEAQEAYRDDNMWRWMEEDDAERTAVQKEIDAFSGRLREELRNRKAVQERLAFTLSRLSPASAYQLASMNIAATDAKLKRRYEDAMEAYRTAFSAYTTKKQKESGAVGGIMISMSGDGEFRLKADRGAGSLDLSGLPRFQAPTQTLRDVARSTMTDVGLLLLYTIAVLAAAVAAFLRYDVR